MTAAIAMGAAVALAAVATAELRTARSERPVPVNAPPPDTTTASPPPPEPEPTPVLPFNAKLTSSDIPVRGGGVRSGGCSGALIAPEWVITAGHCFHDINDAPISGRPPNTTTVTIGKLNDADPAGHTLQVIDVRQSPVNDIALARLSGPVNDIQPLIVANQPPTVGQQLLFAGWGSRSATGTAPANRLKRGRFTVLAIAPTTLEADSTAPRTVDNSPCPADSGAPFFTSTDDRTGTLLAVESTGPPCPQPGREVISRVDVIAEWIRRQTGYPSR